MKQGGRKLVVGDNMSRSGWFIGSTSTQLGRKLWHIPLDKRAHCNLTSAIWAQVSSVNELTCKVTHKWSTNHTTLFTTIVVANECLGDNRARSPGTNGLHPSKECCETPPNSVALEVKQKEREKCPDTGGTRTMRLQVGSMSHNHETTSIYPNRKVQTTLAA